MTEPTRLCRHQHGRVLVLTMESDCGKHPVSPELGRQISTAISDAGGDDTVGVIILTGAGNVFSAGGDIRGLITSFEQPRPDAEVRAMLSMSASACLALMDSPKPTIAMVAGAAAGGGLALAAACDIRVAGQSAKFAYAYPRIALGGDLGANWALTRILGVAKARHFCLAAKVHSASAALDLGLVSAVHSEDLLFETTLEMATDIASMSPTALAHVKTNLEAAASLQRDAAIEVEVRTFLEARSHADHREAAQAFLERRSPRWS